MTEYAFRQIGAETWEVAKFDEKSEPVSVYTLGKKFCTCPGSVRTAGGCTHIKMLSELLDLNIELRGMLYDKDHDRIYRPIPLDAPFKIPTAAEVISAQEDSILAEIPF